MKAFVITICQIAPMTKLRRKFGNKRLAVEGIVERFLWAVCETIVRKLKEHSEK